MFFHVLLTTECDLKCKYCFGGSCLDIDSDFDFAVEQLPTQIDYNLEDLAAFCKKDPECIISLYGGEPMLCLAEIQEIIDKVKAKHFLLQTNGLHLNELSSNYTNRIHTILVSIDGRRELTDYYRGCGVYQRIVENLAAIRRNGFQGEIIARMTIMEETDVESEVKWLLSNGDFDFTSVHWQLNAGFWGNDFARRPFESWVRGSYNPGIRRLVKFWIDTMGKYGKVLRLYPFLGLMWSLLHGEKDSSLRCGSGWINYAILTNGSIVPCPIMGGMKDYCLGSISDSDPLTLRKIFVSQPCVECEMFGVCGGRCLYANITKRWSDQAYALVCSTVKNMISSLREEKKRIEILISKGTIRLSDFNYMKFNGCEIIP